MKTNHRTHKLLLSLAVAVFLGVITQAADVAGTWTWTSPGRNGGPDRTNTLSLKIDADKLTGKLTMLRRGEPVSTDIADGKVDGDKVSFTVVREYNGNSFTNKYSGTLSADTITGKMEFTRDGDTQSRDWKAIRAADAAPAPAAK